MEDEARSFYYIWLLLIYCFNECVVAHSSFDLILILLVFYFEITIYLTILIVQNCCIIYFYETYFENLIINNE